MDPISIALFAAKALSHAPVVDLLVHGVTVPASGDGAGGVLAMGYDVMQFMIALNGLALGVNKLAKITPWTWDDGFARGFLGLTTKALSLMTRFGSTYNPKAGMVQPGVPKLVPGR